MQGGRIEVSEYDAARKKYVDDRDEVKAAELRVFVVNEDQKLTQKLADGDIFKSIQTKNTVKLRTSDFNTGATQLNVFMAKKEIAQSSIVI